MPIEKRNTKSPGPELECELECCVEFEYCVEGYGTRDSLLTPIYGVKS